MLSFKLHRYTSRQPVGISASRQSDVTALARSARSIAIRASQHNPKEWCFQSSIDRAHVVRQHEDEIAIVRGLRAGENASAQDFGRRVVGKVQAQFQVMKRVIQRSQLFFTAY